MSFGGMVGKNEVITSLGSRRNNEVPAKPIIGNLLPPPTSTGSPICPTLHAVHVQAIWVAINRASSPSCSIVVFLEASKRVSPVVMRGF